MSRGSLGFCGNCKARVPAEYRLRDGQVWFVKNCPECGPNESLISSDAAVWQAKRNLWEGVPARQSVPCSLHCDRCQTQHGPTMLFMDVTNRCNMDCPMCGFSLRRMGFDFNPPLEYFEKVLRAVSEMRPRPVVNLFGGEPTVRDDMFEIIAISRRYGLDTQITTNGLRLADEAYCRRICESGVGLRLAFDGRAREIYVRLRNNGPAYARKLQALENLRKYSRRKHTIVACLAAGINDEHLADLIQFCHENRQFISDLGIIPLYENWKPGEFKIATHTTAEDVEKMVQRSVPGGGVEFIPAGMSHWLAVLRPFFSEKPGLGLLTFAGVHPNCESLTFLIAGHDSYRGLNHYMNKSLAAAARELGEIVERIQPRLARLDPRKPLQRLQGKMICLAAIGPWLWRTIDKRRVFGGHSPWGAVQAGWSLWKRRRIKRRTGRPSPATYLRLAVLPFEEQHSVDSERLKSCRAGMPYENVKTGRIEIIPHCLWFPYRDAILKTIADKYGNTRVQKRAA